ncbi:MAG: cytochrome C [Pseudomonadota bacterium]
MRIFAIASVTSLMLGLALTQAGHTQDGPVETGLPVNDPDDIIALCGGDPSMGISGFEASCAACHTLAEGEPHMDGPNLYALYGRVAGSADGFDYSAAMVASGEAGLIWDRDTLQPFFQDVDAVVPGTVHPQMPEMVDEAYRTNLMTHVRLTTTPPPPSLDEVVVPAEVLEMEGDFAYGEYLASECASCHVPGGNDAANIPSIHGLDRDYMMLALYQYRLGARDNTTMVNIAARLGDEEIAALAAYFAAQ